MADKRIEIEVVTNTDVSQLDDLKDSIEDAKTSAEDLGTSVDGATDSVDGLSGSVDGIDGGNVGEVAGEFDELGNSADGADTEVQELQGSLDTIEAGSLLSISSEMSNMGASAEGMSQQINTASISVGQLATQTGIAEPQMVSLINHISNATFPQEEAMAYVQALHQMGVSSEHLGESATDMDRMNDAFGIGYENTIKLTQGLRSLGVSADNIPSSYNALAYAQSNVTGGVGTFTTALQRQGKLLNQYGLDADQTAIILGKLSERGLSARNINQVLGQSLKDCNGDVTALEQSLGLETGTLSNASAVTAQYEGQVQSLADEEAEHKTWIDRATAAWEDFALANAGVIGPLTSALGLIGQAGSFAVGLNGLLQLGQAMKGLKLITLAKAAADKVAAAAQWLLNAAMSANPITLIIIAIIALIVILGYLYFNNEQVRNAINNLGQTFMQVGQLIYTAVVNFVQTAIQALTGFWNFLVQTGQQIYTTVVNTVTQVITGIWNFIVWWYTLPIQIATVLAGIISNVISFGSNLVSSFVNSAVTAVSNFMKQISSLPGKFVNELNRMLSAVNEWAATLPQKFWEAGVNAVKNFLGALGIASPGTMQRMLIWEITEMGKRVPKASETVISNVGAMGDEIIDAYGNPTFGNKKVLASINGNGGEAGKQEINVTFEGCMFDKRERVDEVLDILTNHFSWNNITAGRTN